MASLEQSFFRISDVLILQENKRPKLNNSCNDFCNNNEFCLLTPKGASCVCPDGYVNANFTCKPYVPPAVECPLNCNTGVCQVRLLRLDCLAPRLGLVAVTLKTSRFCADSQKGGRTGMPLSASVYRRKVPTLSLLAEVSQWRSLCIGQSSCINARSW